MTTSSRSATERWSATENSVSLSTSSPHRSIRTGESGGRGEDVDDRTAYRHLAPVLDLVLAPVAEVGQLLHQLVQVYLRPAHHLQRLGVLHVRPEPLEQRPDGRDDHGRDGRIIGAVTQPAAAATSAPAAGPSSRPRG